MRAAVRTDEAISVMEGDAGLDALGIPGGGFIDGEWVTSDLSLAVTDPEDDALIARVHVGDTAAMERAIAGVQRSLRGDDWELWERRETLERAASLIRAESARLARIISAESSKTITEATREAARTAETIRPRPPPATCWRARRSRSATPRAGLAGSAGTAGRRSA